MVEPTRCEICGKPINPAHLGVEYYKYKRTDDYKIMYRHEDCPKHE